MRRGMRLGEALARCPRLALVPPDPVGVADAWERVLARLEGIGAAVESERPGLACFDAARPARLHGGRLEGVARRDARGALRPRRPATRRRADALRRAGRRRARAGARRPGGHRRTPRGAGGRAGRAAGAARGDRGAARAARAAGGRSRSATLAALPRDALADRFGRPGCSPHELVRGRDTPLRPRRPGERLEEALELPESGSGQQLERALGMLVDRLLARRERRGRTLRAVVALGARSSRAARGASASSSARRWPIRRACASRSAAALAPLPAPAETLRLASSASARRTRRAARCSTTARRSAPRAAARGGPPGARRGRARARRCACSRSIPARACPSAATVLTPFERDRSAASRRAAARARARGTTAGARWPSTAATVDAVRESWLVEDRWWTERPLRRRYWEVVTTGGRNVVVFRDLVGGRLVRASADSSRKRAASVTRRDATGWPRAGDATGQASVEYVAVVALVAAVLGTRAAPSSRPALGERLVAAMRRALCVVAGGACATAAVRHRLAPRDGV